MKKTLFPRLALALAACTLVLGSTALLASELDPARVPADADWLIHVDFDAMTDSELAEELRDKKPQLTKMVHNWMQQQYGIDPPEDLHSATMFSRDYRQYTGTVILDADFEPSKIKSKLQQGKKHRTTEWEGYTLHTVTLSKQPKESKGPSGDQEMTVVIVDKNTLLLASSVPNAKAALKLLDGDAESLKDNKSPLLTDMADEAWIYGAAINLQKLQEQGLPMPVLAQHQKIIWAAGKRDGQLFEHVELTAQSVQVAKKMHEVLQGVLAYEQLRAYHSEPTQKLLDNADINRDGNVNSCSWEGDTSQVLAALDDAFTRLSYWKRMIRE